MSDILLLLGVMTETGEVCFNYKEGLTRPAEKKNEPPSVPTLWFGFNEGPATLSPAGGTTAAVLRRRLRSELLSR